MARISQTPQRFVGGTDRWPLRQAEQYRKVMRIAGAFRFLDDVGVAAQACSPDGLYRARHRRGDRQAILTTDIAIGTSSTVPLRTICSALSRSALTVASSVVSVTSR